MESCETLTRFRYVRFVKLLKMVPKDPFEKKVLFLKVFFYRQNGKGKEDRTNDRILLRTPITSIDL